MRKFSKIAEGWGENVDFYDEVDSETLQKIKDLCASLTDNGVDLRVEKLYSGIQIKLQSNMNENDTIEGIINRHTEGLGECLDRIGEVYEIYDYHSGCTTEQRSLSNKKYWININIRTIKYVTGY